MREKGGGEEGEKSRRWEEGEKGGGRGEDGKGKSRDGREKRGKG